MTVSSRKKRSKDPTVIWKGPIASQEVDFSAALPYHDRNWCTHYLYCLHEQDDARSKKRAHHHQAQMIPNHRRYISHLHPRARSSDLVAVESHKSKKSRISMKLEDVRLGQKVKLVGNEWSTDAAKETFTVTRIGFNRYSPRYEAIHITDSTQGRLAVEASEIEPA